MPIEFAYAQARAQARHGERLSPETWSLLESSVGLAQFLHLVRGTALTSLVEHFSAATSPHTVERSLRHEWHREVNSVTRWVPARWRPAVAWTTWLAELPAVSHLLDGGMPLPWMAEDPALSAFAGGDAETRRASIEEALPALALDDGTSEAGRTAWLRHWRSLWPDDAADDPALLHFMSMVERHSRDETDASDWRSSLEQQALRILRWRREQPVTVFCHLLLSALDLHRLRQGLLQRALFNDLDREVAV